MKFPASPPTGAISRGISVVCAGILAIATPLAISDSAFAETASMATIQPEPGAVAKWPDIPNRPWPTFPPMPTFPPDEGPDVEPEEDPEDGPIPEPTAEAHAVVCDNKGKSWFTWNKIAKPVKLTHASRYENNTGEKMDATLTAQHQSTITAGTTITAGGGISGSVVVASLDGKVETTLQASGAKTTSRSIAVKVVIPVDKVSIVYGGTVKVTGNYKYQTCNRDGILRTVQTGTGRSWTVLTSGGVQCDRTPKTAMGKLAKKRWC